MALTPAQKTALLANIQATPEALAIYTDGNLVALADFYNAPHSPVYWVWRTSITKNEITSSVSVDGTAFSFPQLIARTPGEQFGWRELFNGSDTCNPSLTNVRQGFADVFSGAQAGPVAQRAHLLAMSRRQATRIERLFATGTGSTASPGVMSFEGALSFSDLIGL